METQTELAEFFAVTLTSVYRVSAGGGEHDWPIVEKIRIFKKSRVPVGARLDSAPYVGITGYLITYFFEDNLAPPFNERRASPDDTNTRYWRGTSSLLVALFLSEQEAVKCSGSPDLKPRDPRWRNETQQTLKAIGKDHPRFIISYNYKWSIAQSAV